MRGKTKESHYLITKLFATDYFYFYCKPLLFFTYFFPYQISKNGQFSTYEEFEYEKRMIFGKKNLESTETMHHRGLEI